MTQNRPAPAYQEYAASLIARTEYRILSLTQRGLLWSVKLECWVNHRVPADPATLARILGYSIDEVQNALPMIMPFLAINDGDLICPELDDYRAHLQTISHKKSEGGKRGAAMTNGRRKGAETLERQASDHPSGIPQLSRGSLVKSSSVQFSKTQPLERVASSDPWVTDYEAASNGR